MAVCARFTWELLGNEVQSPVCFQEKYLISFLLPIYMGNRGLMERWVGRGAQMAHSSCSTEGKNEGLEVKNWERCLHSQGTVSPGTFLYACPFPSSDVKNEAQESTLRVLRTLTEPLGEERRHRVEDSAPFQSPFTGELFHRGTYSPLHPVLPISANYSEIISPTSQGESALWSLC